MMRSALVLLALSAAPAACAAPVVYAPPGSGYADAPTTVYRTERPAMRLVEGPYIPPPANDISEARRREWFDAQRPRVEAVPAPTVVERVYVREPAPVRYVSTYRRCDDWYLPISLSLGYWGGGGYRGHHGGYGGWRWGVGLNWAYPFCWR